jgi:hypothetical protein
LPFFCLFSAGFAIPSTKSLRWAFWLPFSHEKEKKLKNYAGALCRITPSKWIIPENKVPLGLTWGR